MIKPFLKFKTLDNKEVKICQDYITLIEHKPTHIEITLGLSSGTYKTLKVEQIEKT